MLFLKVSNDGEFLIVVGRLFHIVADVLLKHLSPYITVRVLGTVSRASDADRSDLVGWYEMMSSCRYGGAVPCKALYVYIRTLYLDRDSTGSQCKVFKTGVMCSRFRVRVTSRAALFCTLCRGLVSV